ncbi:hypothetical protein A3K73_02865 [Candidatus Pacearchaeota archaeon RBG_13_36_9]|nr:MAG: hypothetical protein A3K73_02865 [Candidatus Pacearchaeota archaeon RBG_13_36_9]
MGKNRVIKSLGKNIGNLVVHKILAKYTNNPEAVEHLRHEIIAYRENTKEIAESFNWNDSEIAEIKLEAMDALEKEMHRDYPDVNFPMEEAERLFAIF